MHRAIDLARNGVGHVEPNPMVGCVVVKEGQIIGEGWHEKWGGPHAEINAIAAAKRFHGDHAVRGATVYVTLEPCSHHGKTPPCAEALVEAGVSQVVIAHPDPNPLVAGEGIKRLEQAGIRVELGELQSAAAEILAPYLKRLQSGLPWVIAKWAMTLDGKIATATGNSQWISNEQARAVVHQIRGRVDAIMVGSKTAATDDPLLTARPAGPRIATRIVLDSTAGLNLDSKLCETAGEIPTIVAVAPAAAKGQIEALKKRGCDVWQHLSADANERLMALLKELARRGMTNVLVEGGSGLLGSLNDLDQIDETHVFMGPQLLGGQTSISPFAGIGHSTIAAAAKIQFKTVQQLDDNVYIVGRRV